MGHIRCKDCGWLQDQFWTNSYTPLDELNNDHMRECLIALKTTAMDKWMAEELGLGYKETNDGICLVESKDYVVYELQETINKIRNMKWRTELEWKVYLTANGPKCPECGKNGLLAEDF